MAALALTLGGLVAVGCGDGDGSDRPGDPGTGELTISYTANDSAPTRTATLTCPATGATRVAACEELESLSAPFDPLPADAVCTEQYGGPQVVSVVGIWQGDPVNITFARTNGCEIAQYDDVAAVLIPVVT